MDGKLDPSVPFETETNNQIQTKPPPPKLLNRQPTECHRNLFPRISVCRKQARYEDVHHLHLVSGNVSIIKRSTITTGIMDE